jgi:hypothetical protein
MALTPGRDEVTTNNTVREKEKAGAFIPCQAASAEDRNPHPERFRGDCRPRTVRPAPRSAVFVS